ncbi:MAG: DsrH/TusB family sulfur metabolism protein [Candidatus Methanomethylophilaceae archaeon]|jgi:sulfur relay protein TusB/DsrH|nr:DsrH/TusB family sulfur metabolism protein [Candidatus Methanomethylophilaceae archaeon]
MTSILFLLLKSPHEYCDLEILGKISGEAPRSAVLLNDAALFAVNKEAGERLRPWVDEVYVMRDDLEARGLPVQGDVSVIDYGKLVDLIMDEFDQTVTI